MFKRFKYDWVRLNMSDEKALLREGGVRCGALLEVVSYGVGLVAGEGVQVWRLGALLGVVSR